MNISIQLLDFNENNSSKSLLNNLIPTEKDKQTCNQFRDKHETFLSEREYKSQVINQEDIENETDEYIEAFGVLSLEWMDVNYLIEEDAFDIALRNCSVENFYDCIAYRKENSECFLVLMNLLANMKLTKFECIDVNFKSYDFSCFCELIANKMKESKPVIINYIYYVNE